jgi:tRNA A-37 threonylcarbamoyl transferase component Bud32
MNNNEQIANQPPSRPEQNAENKELIDGMIESLILQHSSYVNEGNNGIIKKVNIDELPEIIKESLRKHCPGIFRGRTQMAIKMLKIYTGGKGKNEFAMQSQAHAIMADNKSSDFAEIPEPLLYHEAEIKSEETKDRLRQEGLKIVSDKIEILLMDYIEGEDLAENLYREVVKHHPDLKFLRDEAERLKLNDLHGYVSSYLGFKRPGGKHLDEGMKNFEKEIVHNQNAERIIKFLRAKGYTMDPMILAKIKNTLERLHANNLFHRDLHERNIMLTYDPDGKLEKVTIVDFGSAIKVEGDIRGQDIYDLDTDKKLVSDEMILRRYEPLAKSSSDEAKENLSNLKSELKTLSARLAKKPEWKKMLASLNGQRDIEEAIKIMESTARQISGTNGDLGWQIKAAAILEISENNPNLADAYYDKEIKGRLANVSPFIKRLFNDLKQII